jgi:hypothetical protein
LCFWIGFGWETENPKKIQFYKILENKLKKPLGKSFPFLNALLNPFLNAFLNPF